MSNTKIIYRDVELKVVKTRLFQKRHLKDPSNIDYTMTEWTIDVDCYYNPQATSIKLNPDNSLNQSSGHQPFETDQALQRFLSAPRGTLKIIGLGSGTGAPTSVLLTSPISGMSCDVMGGPFVESCSVGKVHGLKTWLVSIRIVTYINNCLTTTSRSAMESSVLLSHQWKQYHDVNEDFFTTIINEGTAIFRMDALRKMNRHPDRYRGVLVQPIPSGFKREQIHVTVNEPGNIVRYRTVDVQQPYGIPSEKCTRVEAFQTSSYVKNNIYSSAMGSLPGIASTSASAMINVTGTVANSAISAAGEFFNPFGSGNVLRPIGEGAAGIISTTGNAMLSSASQLASAVANSVPSVEDSIVVRVWGSKLISRISMFDLAFSITSSRIVQPWSKSVGMVLHQALTAKMIELRTVNRAGIEHLITGAFTGGVTNPIAELFGDSNAAAGQFVNNRASLPETIGYNGRNLVIDDPGDTITPIFPKDNNSRGTWLGSMIHQSLASSPCQSPSANPRQSDLNIRTQPVNWR